ncbi:hypothetical protein DFH09DRAFT_906177, partial [Mycena vulgaris]
LPAPKLSPVCQAALPPGTHLLCCNCLYFGISALEAAEDISPAWHAVGRHMHFTPKIQEIAASYTRRTLVIGSYERIPSYIAVYVRRDDFAIWCNIDGVHLNECFAPLSTFARRVRAALIQQFHHDGHRRCSSLHRHGSIFSPRIPAPALHGQSISNVTIWCILVAPARFTVPLEALYCAIHQLIRPESQILYSTSLLLALCSTC